MSVRPRGLNDDRTVRILIDHTAPPEAYHEWVWVGAHLQADANGVSRGARGGGRAWAKVVCNNPECAGAAFVDVVWIVSLAYADGLRP